MQEGANATHIRALPQVFKEFNRTIHLRRRATGGGDGSCTGSGGEGPAVAEQVFEVRVTAGPRSTGVPLMADNHRKSNDHDRRLATIVALATKIGLILCQSEYRHLGEHEWARLDRMRIELGALRAEAGL